MEFELARGLSEVVTPELGDMLRGLLKPRAGGLMVEAAGSRLMIPKPARPSLSSVVSSGESATTAAFRPSAAPTVREV